MEFKFKQEVAETLGLNNAVLLEYIKCADLHKCKIESILKDLTFWDENELMTVLIDLNVKGLIELDTEKKIVSLSTVSSKIKLQTPKKIKKSNMASDWSPSIEVLEILVRSGMNEAFVKELIPEFVIYWSERPDVLISYNSKFIEHARLKWAQYNAEVDTKKSPTVINNAWVPSDDCIDIIKMTGIDVEFAEKYLPEFILYWKEDGRAFTSWDIKFLDFIKKKWNFNIEHSSNGNKEEFDFYDPYKETVGSPDKSNSDTLTNLREKYKI
ncbi:MAG: hypothetical protein CBC72_001625 [Gammaproteobacteria bacterium TMED112]|nr:MAG: hypothetical protein CBC72_001625 [Gammaproteobacteria bacterium TMED112]|tara:strand:- start:12563 stop:13369 length:807 start_codon:yes stop_codon:yes gene_type:complete